MYYFSSTIDKQKAHPLRRLWLLINEFPSIHSIGKNMSLRDCVVPEQKQGIENSQMNSQGEKEKRYNKWAELVLAGKTNLPLCDWMSQNEGENQ
jgi:hypothetical protein